MAGAKFSQLLKGINPGPVAVAPGDLDGVAADRIDFERIDLFGDFVRVDSWSSSCFIDTRRAGAGETLLTGDEKAFVSVFPLDEDIVDVGAGNFGGNHIKKRF